MDNITNAMMQLIAFDVCGKSTDGEAFSACRDFSDADFIELYKLSKKHDSAHLVGDALVKNNLLQDGKIKSAFEKELYTSVFRCESLNYELTNLKKILSDDEIPFIPLKGSVLRAYYPQAWMRTSCDIDILIHEEDLDRAEKILSENGYKIEVRGQHDLSVYSQSGVHIELHFKLQDLVFKNGKILENVWQSGEVLQIGQAEYAMSNELFLLYHIYHMAKHFLHGGCGIKPFIDLWVIENKMQLDCSKAEKLLKESDLYAFYEHSVALMHVWLCGSEHTEITQSVEDYILQGGVYGNLEQDVAISQVQKGGKVKNLFGRIFLSYPAMCVYYPSTKKCPLLLPFNQVRRWFRILFRDGGKKAMHEMKVNATLDKTTVDATAKMLSDLGL